MVCDERDIRYKVTFRIWRHATRVKCVRYFSDLDEARAFARERDGSEIRRVMVNVADMIIIGEKIYGRCN